VNLYLALGGGYDTVETVPAPGPVASDTAPSAVAGKTATGLPATVQ
jgi:hypothetical protein